MTLNEENVVVNGRRLHYYYYEVKGTTPVILFHGIGVSSRYMLPLARELARSHSVYAVDLPGFGKSGKLHAPLSMDSLANAVAGFFAATSLNTPAIVGNSFGCQVGLRVINAIQGLLVKPFS